MANDEQINLHPNPMGKPNGLSLEGLAKALAVLQNDVAWIKQELQKRDGQIDSLQNEIQKVSNMLATIVTKDKNFEEDLKDIKKVLQDHETRLRSAERHDWMEVGIAATLGSLFGGGLIALLIKLMFGL